MGKLVRMLAALALAAACLPGAALAQTAATGSIEGVVTDATGGVLPGVTVVVKNSGTNLTRDLVTDDGGRYRATALQPGTYEVTATLAGFTAAPPKSVTVQVGQTQAVDIKMHPAGVTETVTVTGEVPLVDTRRTDVSNVIGEKAIENLPINGRRWENFVLLSPGVTNDGGFGLVSYRGISGLYNNNTVDGADNNQAFFSEARGRTRTSYSMSQAAIKEFQVGISNFSAEFGRAAGGSVNAVTKSGTNKNSGEAFYFLRDDKFRRRTSSRRSSRASGASSSGRPQAARSSRTRSSTSSTTTAAPRLPLLRELPRDVHDRGLHGARVRLHRRVLQRVEHLLPARRAPTTSRSARWTCR